MSLFNLNSDIDNGDAKSIARSLSTLRSITNFELLGVGAVGILLLVPGVLDEILAGSAMVGAMMALVFLRRSFSTNRERIIGVLEQSKLKGELTEEAHKQAMIDLNTVTVAK